MRIERNSHISPSSPFPSFIDACHAVWSEILNLQKSRLLFRFFSGERIQVQNERELFPRLACPRSTPTSSFGIQKKKERVKWRLFCLPNSKLILIFGKTSPSYSYGRNPPGHFVYFVQKDLRGRSLCFFTRIAIFKSK